MVTMRTTNSTETWEGNPKREAAEMAGRKRSTNPKQTRSEKYRMNQNAYAKIRPRRLELDARKRDTPCKDCGEYFPHYNMEFDHVRGEKSFAVSALNATLTLKYPDDVWYAEMDKCDLVCSHCHNTRTYFRARINGGA